MCDIMCLFEKLEHQFVWIKNKFMVLQILKFDEFHFLIFDLFISVNAIAGGCETRKNRLFMTYLSTGR